MVSKTIRSLTFKIRLLDYLKNKDKAQKSSLDPEQWLLLSSRMFDYKANRYLNVVFH